MSRGFPDLPTPLVRRGELAARILGQIMRHCADRPSTREEEGSPFGDVPTVDANTVVLFGPSGMGKTVLATALAHELCSNFNQVIFLDAGTEGGPFHDGDGLPKSVMLELLFMEATGMPMDGGVSTSEDLDLAVKEALANLGHVLVVLDSASTAAEIAAVASVLDKRSRSCLMVTTRVEHIADYGLEDLIGAAVQVEVGRMTVVEAEVLLLGRAASLLSSDERVADSDELAGDETKREQLGCLFGVGSVGGSAAGSTPASDSLVRTAVGLCDCSPTILTVAGDMLAHYGGSVDAEFLALLAKGDDDEDEEAGVGAVREGRRPGECKEPCGGDGRSAGADGLGRAPGETAPVVMGVAAGTSGGAGTDPGATLEQSLESAYIMLLMGNPLGCLQSMADAGLRFPDATASSPPPASSCQATQLPGGSLDDQLWRVLSDVGADEFWPIVAHFLRYLGAREAERKLEHRADDGSSRSPESLSDAAPAGSKGGDDEGDTAPEVEYDLHDTSGPRHVHFRRWLPSPDMLELYDDAIKSQVTSSLTCLTLGGRAYERLGDDSSARDCAMRALVLHHKKVALVEAHTLLGRIAQRRVVQLAATAGDAMGHSGAPPALTSAFPDGGGMATGARRTGDGMSDGSSSGGIAGGGSGGSDASELTAGTSLDGMGMRPTAVHHFSLAAEIAAQAGLHTLALLAGRECAGHEGSAIVDAALGRLGKARCNFDMIL